MFVNYQVFKISGNSNGGQVRKRKEHVCINTDSKVQTGAILF